MDRRCIMTENRTRLYLMTPPRLDATTFTDILGEVLDSGDVACVQLRLKDTSSDEIQRAAELLGPVVQDRDVAFIMNDHPRLARECGCDGVHIEQEDTTYDDARIAIGPNGIVGVTCHASRHLAVEAGERGADYVTFGDFFHTPARDSRAKAETELLEWWSDVTTVPCVAMGGITVENCLPLVTAGADFIAVAGGVWDHEQGPAAAVRAFNKILDEN